MQNLSTNATPAPPGGQLVLNVAKLNELRRAHEISTDTELAKVLGVDRTTLYRVIAGGAPSNIFMARTKLAFPAVSLDALFVVDRLLPTLHQVRPLEKVAS
jgi:DNA-binding XRE family transcriptional regulator